jgi:hypothetical protein
MGIDTITKATDAFERKQRRCLDLFGEPNLFSGVPRLSIAVVAVPDEGHVFHTGEEYRLAVADDSILVIRDITVVGRLDNPPLSVIELMRGPLPSVFGRVVRVFSLTGKAELQLE